MKLTLALAAITLSAVVTSTSFAQTNDHFARQRREAVARQQALQQNLQNQRSSHNQFDISHRHSTSISRSHWGGPTTTHRYYPPTRSHIYHQRTQYYPVSPFGFGIPYGGYYGGFSPYRSPYCATPFAPSIYIHREIYHGR